MTETELHWSSKTVFAVGVALVSGSVGYFIAKKRYERIFQKELQRELLMANKYYSILYKKERYATPEAAVKSLTLPENVQEIVEQYSPTPDQFPEVEAPEEEVDPASHFVMEEELEKRTAEKPYVITDDEHFAGELNYEQTTITYFEGDDVLADERDQVIDDREGTVGEENLYRFGHGSRDNNIVYVRNERLEVDFEVIRNKGRFAEIVLGFVQHSDEGPKIRRFRGDDG